MAKLTSAEIQSLQALDSKQDLTEVANAFGLTRYECAALWKRERPGKPMVLSIQKDITTPPIETPVDVGVIT